MKDPDQPELNDPRRKEYDFQQARAAQEQMASGSFGDHGGAILPGDGERPQPEASDAVKQSVTQVTASAAGTTVSTEQKQPRREVSFEQVERNREVRQKRRDGMDRAAKAIKARKQVQQETFNQLRQQAQPIMVQPGMEAGFQQRPQQPSRPPQVPQMQSPVVNDAPPETGEFDGGKAALPPREPVLPMLQKMAPYERPIEEIKAPGFVEKKGPIPQAPPEAQRRQSPKLPTDRTAFAPLEPVADPGAKTADPPKSSRQSSDIEQGLEMSEAMDHYGIVMAEFGEAVADSIRSLTRRINDVTRAIQGEGHDYR